MWSRLFWHRDCDFNLCVPPPTLWGEQIITIHYLYVFWSTLLWKDFSQNTVEEGFDSFTWVWKIGFDRCSCHWIEHEMGSEFSHSWSALLWDVWYWYQGTQEILKTTVVWKRDSGEGGNGEERSCHNNSVRSSVCHVIKFLQLLGILPGTTYTQISPPPQFFQVSVKCRLREGFSSRL